MFITNIFANILVPNLPDDGVLDLDNHEVMDPRVDYETLGMRVTDKDSTGRILKLKSENNNIKFLKIGDTINFNVNKHPSDLPCRATVKGVEDHYVSVYVNQFEFCWPENKYFPRGLMLNVRSKDLARRIFEGSQFRSILLKKKDSFLKQLNSINHFLWNYNQEKIKLAADYDQQINELKKKKQLAIDNAIKVKEENILLQAKLRDKLNALDKRLDHYKVERQENLLDRWNLDHDMGHPVSQRPLRLKKP